jgi:geranylgeranyl pyrophosphate synthase
MINISFGQATDIAWHRGLIATSGITEHQYLQMCSCKTGTLARMSAKLAAVLADADDDLTERIGKFAETIAVAFQIQDDILDLISEEFSEGKGGLGRDITEGKHTLLVIHSLDEADAIDRQRLMGILNMHTTDKKLRGEAISIIRKYGSIEYAKKYALNMVEKSWDEIDGSLPPSNAKKELKAFTSYLVERKI